MLPPVCIKYSSRAPTFWIEFLATCWNLFFCNKVEPQGAGSHVTHIKGRHFFLRKPHHIIYQLNRLESANKILYSDRYVFFNRLEDIKQNVWSRDHFWRHRFFYFWKNWTISIADKNRLTGRIEKIKYSI